MSRETEPNELVSALARLLIPTEPRQANPPELSRRVARARRRRNATRAVGVAALAAAVAVPLTLSGKSGVESEFTGIESPTNQAPTATPFSDPPLLSMHDACHGRSVAFSFGTFPEPVVLSSPEAVAKRWLPGQSATVVGRSQGATLLVTGPTSAPFSVLVAKQRDDGWFLSRTLGCVDDDPPADDCGDVLQVGESRYERDRSNRPDISNGPAAYYQSVFIPKCARIALAVPAPSAKLTDVVGFRGEVGPLMPWTQNEVPGSHSLVITSGALVLRYLAR